jgi:hypothetical protein
MDWMPHIFDSQGMIPVAIVSFWQFEVKGEALK